jgi:excisionase family DNA binding protein
MNIAVLEAVPREWRVEVEMLRHRGADAQARALESCAEDLEAALRGWTTEELTIAEAAEESGYSADHLRELVRTGHLPDQRPQGSKGRMRISRSDLPRRPSAPEPSSDLAIVDDLASELLG